MGAVRLVLRSPRLSSCLFRFFFLELSRTSLAVSPCSASFSSPVRHGSSFFVFRSHSLAFWNASSCPSPFLSCYRELATVRPQPPRLGLRPLWLQTQPLPRSRPRLPFPWIAACVFTLSCALHPSLRSVMRHCKAAEPAKWSHPAELERETGERSRRACRPEHYALVILACAIERFTCATLGPIAERAAAPARSRPFCSPFRRLPFDRARARARLPSRRKKPARRAPRGLVRSRGGFRVFFPLLVAFACFVWRVRAAFLLEPQAPCLGRAPWTRKTRANGRGRARANRRAPRARWTRSRSSCGGSRWTLTPHMLSRSATGASDSMHAAQTTNGGSDPGAPRSFSSWRGGGVGRGCRTWG